MSQKGPYRWSSMEEARKSVRLGEPHCYTNRGWVEATKHAKKGACHAAKHLVTEPRCEGKGDYLGMVAYQTPPGQSARLESVVPNKKYRSLVRQMRLGMVGDTRVRVARQCSKAKLSNMCPHCPGEKQTSPHVLLDCVVGEEMRLRVREVYESHMAASKQGGHQGLSFHAMLNHVLSNNSPMSKAQDKSLREAVLAQLKQHSSLITEQLCEENSIVTKSGSQCYQF